MEDKSRGNRIANLISGIYVVAALWLLGSVCTACYPAIGEPVRRVLAGLEDSPIRAAFSVFADGLEQGSSVTDAVSASVEVLMGEKT